MIAGKKCQFNQKNNSLCNKNGENGHTKSSSGRHGCKLFLNQFICVLKRSNQIVSNKLSMLCQKNIVNLVKKCLLLVVKIDCFGGKKRENWLAKKTSSGSQRSKLF
jgi:hypothetical protein